MGFALAGLQRVREIDRDKALGLFGAAQTTAQHCAQAALLAHRALGASAVPVTTDATGFGIAAAGRGALSTLARERDQDVLRADAEVRAREIDLSAARQHLRVVEKLADKHAALVAAAELRTETITLDEVAGGRHRRRTTLVGETRQPA
jgi:hypothetical protein